MGRKKIEYMGILEDSDLSSWVNRKYIDIRGYTLRKGGRGIVVKDRIIVDFIDIEMNHCKSIITNKQYPNELSHMNHKDCDCYRYYNLNRLEEYLKLTV